MSLSVAVLVYEMSLAVALRQCYVLLPFGHQNLTRDMAIRVRLTCVGRLLVQGV
jgi:hypothetical protein